ncbi:MAG: MFS transporter [Paludibacteraceae bacterium]|nr:MFS transporter [Paludibacteraceae bacterium]
MEEQEEKAKSKEDEALATVFLEQKNTEQIEPACKKAYKWVPSLYFIEGLPNVIVTVLAVAFYNKMGFSNTEVAFFTSWLYLPWVIKPFWSPIVDSFKTKRWWVLGMQFMMGAGFAGIGLLLMQGTSHFFAFSMVLFWLIAFSSATHDIAADGLYILSLTSHEQSFYVGIRNTCYRFSIIAGQGGLLFLAGWLEKKTGNIPMAWSCTFMIIGGAICLFRLYHGIALPKPPCDVERSLCNNHITVAFYRTFYKFITKKGFGLALAFILLFRLGEAQLAKMSYLFLNDSVANGGLGINTKDIGIIYGVFGVSALTVGGLLGGYLVSKDGMKRWFYPMVIGMNVPNLVYVLMAILQPSNYIFITFLLCIEQFGYGFGFTAFTLYLIYFSRGQYKTTFYAISTGFMALGMMLPGLVAGWIQEHIGYSNFFIWVCICTIPGFIIARFLPFDKNFGKKE